jgi:hypothetical protein
MAWREQIAADLWENEHAWALVKRVADALLERQTLSGREVRATVTQTVTRPTSADGGNRL